MQVADCRVNPNHPLNAGQRVVFHPVEKFCYLFTGIKYKHTYSGLPLPFG